MPRSTPHGPVTLQDIGDRLGLSRTTISLALRDHPRISEATKRRVQQAVQKLDYHPDHAARALATGRSNLVGVIVPNAADHYYAEIFRGIEDEAQAAGFQVLLSSGSFDPTKEAQRMSEMLRLKVAGLIAAPAFVSQTPKLPPLLQQIRRDRFPLVLLNRELTPPLFPQVSIDNAGGIRMAVETLVSLGHRRIAYISGTPEVIPVRQRLAAFRRCAAQYGLDANPLVVELSTFSVRGGFDACARLWARAQKKPTAILVFSDAPSLGVMRFLHSQRVEIPGRVSVLGFDGTDTSEFSAVSLSTIATPMYEMGKQAFSLLQEQLKRPHSGPQSILFPVHLIQRESIGRPPKSI